MNREDFLKRCVSLTAGVACIDLVLAGCATLPYVSYSIDGSVAVVKKSDFDEKGFVLLDVDDLPAPIFLSKWRENEYTAILLKCTHRGCRVQPAGDILQCPCHGSRYTWSGIVIRGPAPDNLPHFSVETDVDSIRVSLS